jgi:hypothetical protein
MRRILVIVAAVLAVAGCSSTGSSKNAALVAWGTANLATLQRAAAHVDEVHAAAVANDPAKVRTACQAVADENVKLRAMPAAPDPKVAADIATVVQDWTQGAAECVDALDTNDASKMSTAGTHLQAGTDALNKASADLPS